MGYEVPDHYQHEIEAIAKSQHISFNEALERVVRAGIQSCAPAKKASKKPLASFYGVSKGVSAHGSKAAVDRYVSELRSEW